MSDGMKRALLLGGPADGRRILVNALTREIKVPHGPTGCAVYEERAVFAPLRRRDSAWYVYTHGRRLDYEEIVAALIDGYCGTINPDS